MQKTLCICLLLSLKFSLYTQADFQSRHPIVVIHAEEEIWDEPKKAAWMGIIDNGEGNLNTITDEYNHYSGNIGIETRGNSTQGFEKKSYNLEAWTNDGADMDFDFFGFGSSEDWILHAMVIDKSQLRIPLCFDLFREMGHYAARWKFVEVFLNAEYRGLYIFTEKIKRDKSRVDIAKLDADDLAGDSLTGGYILRIDWLDLEDEEFDEQLFSEYPSVGGDEMIYQWYYPKGDRIAEAQKSYITDQIFQFESAVFSEDYTNSAGKRYTDLIDLKSFADFILINEFAKNSDGYKLSSYLRKDKDSKNSKLVAGPIWDFDQTFGLSVVCSSHDPTGWTYLQNQEGCEDLETMPAWWEEIMADPEFQHYINCRYTELRTSVLSETFLDQWITNHEQFIEQARIRNFDLWEFIGEEIWIEPDPFPQTYDEEIEYLKSWITERLAWMDSNMPGSCEDNELSNTAILQDSEISIYPNPASSFVEINEAKNFKITLISSEGKVLKSSRIDCDRHTLSLESLNSGTYILKLSNHNQTFAYPIFIH